MARTNLKNNRYFGSITALVVVAICCLCAAGVSAAHAFVGTIETAAGSDNNRVFKENALATSIRFRAPEGVALKGDGGFVVSDPKSHRIFEVGTDGRITTLAGTGQKGFSGDNGPAKLAQLDEPSGVVVTKFGETIIVDTGNHRVRKVDLQGVITTIAGTTAGFGGDGGPATAAQLRFPKSVSVRDDGRILIADTGNDRIREIDLNGAIRTVAGGGVLDKQEGGDARAALLLNPKGVAAAPNGRFFIADTDHNKIRSVDANGRIWTEAGTGAPGFSGDGEAARKATLFGPTSIAVTATGFVVSDSHNERVREVFNGIINTIVGGGRPESETLESDVAADYIRSAAENVVEEGGLEDPSRELLEADPLDDLTVIDEEQESFDDLLLNLGGFSGDGGYSTDAQLNSPMGVAVAGDSRLYVADTLNHRVRAVVPQAPIGILRTQELARSILAQGS